MTNKVALAEDKLPTIMEHWRAQVREDGMTTEAIQLAKEFVEYTNSKYPSISIRVYVEQSGEVTTIHSFADYEDMTSFKRVASQFGQDQKWMTMWRKVMAFIVEGTIQQSFLTPMDIFVQEKPVADLSQGQEGRILFTSVNLGSFRELLAGEGQSKPVTISGTLKMPKEVGGKVPAVIILHGAGGVNDHYFEVAEMLNKMGIAAFVVDSFETRGIQSGVNILKKLFHSYSTRISDAYAALELLSTHPKIDKRRIAVMGYSHGAKVALFVASEKIRWSFIADDLRFAASIAYYPGCITQFKNIDFTDAPVLMLLAENDNICPIGACLDYTQRMKNSSADVKTVVYKGAHHMFPVLSGSELINTPSLPDWSNCGKDEYLLLQDDGTWFFPHINKTVAEVNVYGEFTADCRIDKGAIVAGNTEAKNESIKEYQDLLKAVFNLQ
jgi:dienelactone hydrolase